MRSIAVIKLRYIGDTLLMTPVFDALRMAFPKAILAAVVNQGTEPVLWNHPAIDEVIPINRSASMFKYASELQRIRHKHFDLAIDLTGADRSALIAFWSGAPARLGYRGGGVVRSRLLYNQLITANEGAMHKVDYHLAAVEAMGLPVTERMPRLFLTSEEITRTAGLLKEKGLSRGQTYIVLHPGARRWYKSWPSDCFSRLGDRVVRELRVSIVLAGGRADVDTVQTIERGMNVPCINLAGQLNLRELAGLLKGAAVCVVNDSSPMHIAAAVGTPTVSLFGLTDSTVWAPRGAGHQVLSRDCPCRPYGHRRECPEGENWCMRKIPVDEVFDTVEAILSGRERQHRRA
jgi:predicted lipopolysaccharide heptosyltransferase III